MKRIKWILPLLITFLVCGCNYHELNDIYLVSALSVDFDQEYHISLLIASDDEENSTRTIEGHGKTLEEAFFQLSTNYNKPLYLGHLNLVLIDEHAAKKGIESLFQIINEDNETKKNFYLILAENTKAKDVLTYLSSEKVEAKEIEGLSKYLTLESIHNQITYNTYIKQMKENSISTMTSYTIQNEKLQTSNLGIFKNHHLKSWTKETNATMVLNEMTKEFILSLHSQSVIIKNLRVKKKLSNDFITFDVNGKVDSSIKDTREVEQEFKKEIEKAVQESQKLNLDYLRLKPFLYDHNKKTTQSLKDLKVHINVHIDW